MEPDPLGFVGRRHRKCPNSCVFRLPAPLDKKPAEPVGGDRLHCFFRQLYQGRSRLHWSASIPQEHICLFPLFVLGVRYRSVDGRVPPFRAGLAPGFWGLWCWFPVRHLTSLRECPPSAWYLLVILGGVGGRRGSAILVNKKKKPRPFFFIP